MKTVTIMKKQKQQKNKQKKLGWEYSRENSPEGSLIGVSFPGGNFPGGSFPDILKFIIVLPKMSLVT